ncbi:ATP-dependent helicase [Heliobacterium gestii]|uniref:ATP-dependent helicase n=1 Tax=Heliomicrobium gestii TaxID=2699 RepID=A0A845LI22_HELGE|nr:DEAD/DEAH box helicase [Heliomicrobium gestii]MBM7867672.1 SNF2 family DNA or RNA helicase [Heliomicrobium gestii]MZP44065.1 ATP-dependent helicase [Heliomicrobium gestii]
MNLSIRWIPGKGFFLWGDRPFDYGNDPFDRAQEWKFRLFADHRPSFYGSFVDVEEWEGVIGLVLPPQRALDFLLNPPASDFFHWDWSPEIRALQRLAPAVDQALTEKRWQPDYRSWRQGKKGLCLDLAAGDSGGGTGIALADLSEWTSLLVEAQISDDLTARLRWEQLVSDCPMLHPDYPREGPFLDEADWLEAIGWRADRTPFVVSLRLREPEMDEAWRLQVVLFDRDDPTGVIEIPVALAEANAAPVLPAPWQPYAERIGRSVRKWLSVAPRLGRDDESSREGDGQAPKAPRLKAELTEGEAWNFLAEDSLRLAQAGERILLPRWWEDLKKKGLRLKAVSRSMPGETEASFVGMDSLVHFDWKLAVGETELTEAEFREAARQNRRLLRIRGRWVQLDPALVRQALKVMNRKGGEMDLAEVLRLHYSHPAAGDGLSDDDSFDKTAVADGSAAFSPFDPAKAETDSVQRLSLEVELNEQLAQMARQLTQQAAGPLLGEPPGFCGHLRSYQRAGLSWLWFLRPFGFGGCLADDMGLGKTIQWIAYLLQIKAAESQQASQSRRPTPSLLICPTSVLGNWQKELAAFAPSLRVYLHYGPQRAKGEALTHAVAAADLTLTTYGLAHLDESDLGALRWDCLCLDEAQNIKNVYTKQSMAVRQFTARHRVALTGTPMENRLSELWSIMDFLNPGYLGGASEFLRQFAHTAGLDGEAAAAEQVRRLVRPFLLRRVKSDPAIEPDLPDKQESKEFLPLTLEQAALYENVIGELFERIDEETGITRRGLILKTLTRLKQVCDHPALLLKEKTPGDFRRRSAKVDRLLEMIEELRQEGDGCLIFTQYVEMGRLLQVCMRQELGERAEFLHGGVPKARRDDMIERFQSRDDFAILILSLRAGGFGLNLTAANHVFHFDRWWNPAVENQATDRAYRIGQLRHVQVHKFITLGTLEERIDELLERKQGLNDSIVGNGEAWVTELSTRELREIFALRREWVGRE